MERSASGWDSVIQEDEGIEKGLEKVTIGEKNVEGEEVVIRLRID